MDSEKAKLLDLAEGHQGGNGLPPASTSYPHSPTDFGAQPIQYPQPSAPYQENQWSGYQGMPNQQSPPQPQYQQQPPPQLQHQQLPPQAATSFPQPVPPQPSQQNTLPHAAAGEEEGDGTTAPKLRAPIKVEEKSLLEAYILCLPLGFLGLHHFYLGRIGIGFLYFFTFGVFGIGWIIDWFRLPWLVKATNEKRKADAERGYVLYGGPFDELYERSIYSAYLFWLPPVGIFGGHHYYLGRIGYGVIYSLTMGLFGVGWLFDVFRIWILTRRANEDIRTLRSGRLPYVNPADRMYLDDVYSLAFPLGFLGLHHFYMRRWMFGIIYFLTLGCMGVGFLVDLVRLPYLLYRTRNEMRTNDGKCFHVDDAYLMWFPLGIIGMHHFYLHRWGWGFAYFFTFGLFGVGWLIDLCRIPHLVKAANERRSSERLLRNHYHPSGSPPCHCEGAVHPEHGPGQVASYQSIPTPDHRNMLVYAIPLDQHGHPIWSEKSVWTQDASGITDSNTTVPTHWQPGVNGPGPDEPPPPYSPITPS